MPKWMSGLISGLLLPMLAARSGVADYACSNACQAPACVCATRNPPGGLQPTNTPQMIVLTFDDAVNDATFVTVQQVLTNRLNPNGSPAQATFFVSTDWTDYWLVQRLYAAGHEIAIHTMSHTTHTNTDLTTFRAEIAGCRKTLSRLARIPLQDIRGFRAPFLEYNNASFHILAEQGLTYDSSITEEPGGLSLSAGQMIWPYTLDYGVAQSCWTGTAPYENFSGLFEIPLWSLYDAQAAGWISMDPSGSDTRVLALLQTNFLARYAGNRAPLGVFLHADYWSSHTQVLRNFLDWAQTFRDTWLVSMRTLAAYMRSPQPAATVAAFPPFITATHPVVPEAEVRSFSFPKGTVRTCGEQPVAYPATDTVYQIRVPLPGGSLGFQITEQWQNGFNGQLTLTNTTAATAADWGVASVVAGGVITWLSGAAWQLDGARVVLQPNEPDPLTPGARRTITFGGTRTNSVQFLDPVITLYTTAYQQPILRSIAWIQDGCLRLDWDEAAYGYRLEQATNGLLAGWQPVTEVHGSTSWTGAPPAAATEVFYRIRTIP